MHTGDACTARVVFLNCENLTSVRQSKVDPMLLPSRGRAGRCSTDAWTEVTGATVSAGVRLGFWEVRGVASRLIDSRAGLT